MIPPCDKEQLYCFSELNKGVLIERLQLPSIAGLATARCLVHK